MELMLVGIRFVIIVATEHVTMLKILLFMYFNDDNLPRMMA